MDSKGSSVVVGFQDGVVRSLGVTKLEGDHSRRHEKQEAEIILKQAFKPHNGPVSAMAFDGKGEVLATGVNFKINLKGFMTKRDIRHF